MDIQTRKIEFIQKFLKIHSEELISRLEDILSKELKSYDKDDLKPMSVEEFNARIDQSESDFENNRHKRTSDLLKKYDQ